MAWPRNNLAKSRYIVSVIFRDYYRTGPGATLFSTKASISEDFSASAIGTGGVAPFFPLDERYLALLAHQRRQIWRVLRYPPEKPRHRSVSQRLTLPARCGCQPSRRGGAVVPVAHTSKTAQTHTPTHVRSQRDR